MVTNHDVFFAGVDIGSVTAKTVILKDTVIVGRATIPTTVSSERSGLAVLGKALESADLSRSDLKFIIATGYGRIAAPYANKTITEITCHAKGANYLNPKTRTIIDMGGQDCKAMRVNEEGHVIDFVMNDKCAAGTGRFLEIVSRVFELTLDELGPLSVKSPDNERVPISSTCTVFAESEIVSLMARGERSENILSGVHYAIAHRIAGMFTRTGVEDEVFFSGGVAKNIGMRKALEETIEKKIIVSSEDPQLVGALGAALLAREKYLARIS